FVVMEYLKGMTLRHLINSDLKPGGMLVKDIGASIKVFEAFCQLSQSKLDYHGDLKPENIILSGGGVRVIDPGYFGSMRCKEGMVPHVVVSSPQYYPCLEPDDSLAAALCLWELCLGQPLLARVDSMSGKTVRESTIGSQQHRLGESLSNWIAREE